MALADHEPPDRAERMDLELAAIQARLNGLRDRLEAFQPWDHQASAARLRAQEVDAARRNRPPDVV